MNRRDFVAACRARGSSALAAAAVGAGGALEDDWTAVMVERR